MSEASGKLLGECRANRFIAKMERAQRLRLQKDAWELCDENRRLGGTYYKKVLARFAIKESDVWKDEL